MNRPSNNRTGPTGTRFTVSRDGPQLIRTSGKRWSDQAEAQFLDLLAASCNVSASADGAGFSKNAVYQRRRDDPAFAQRWQAALEQGYARIELLLVQRAGEALAGHLPDPEAPLAAMTVKEAIIVLQLHQSSVTGAGRAPGWRARPRPLADMRASILSKLETIEAARRGSDGNAEPA
jgi:hypothetical protein